MKYINNKLYKVYVTSTSTYTYEICLSAPSKRVCRNVSTIINTVRDHDLESLGDAVSESVDYKVGMVCPIDKIEDVPAGWIESIPFFHENYPPVDQDLEMKDYFKTPDYISPAIEAIDNKLSDYTSQMSDIEYKVKCLESERRDLESKLKAKEKNS